LSTVTAYGPPGTARTAEPPSVLSFTDFGAAEKTTVASPPPVVTVAVDAATSFPTRVPLPVSACSGPATAGSTSGPPPVTSVSGPPICVTRAGPPPESTFAPAVPETVAGPPPVDTVAVTSGGTVTLKSTVQPE